MDNKEISTGHDLMDKNIAELFEICDNPERLKNIKDVLAKKDISEKELQEIVPESILYLMPYLMGISYAMNLEAAPENIKPILEKAHSLLCEHFEILLSNPIIGKILKDVSQKEQEGETEKETLTRNCFNRIESITSIVFWGGTPQKLSPSARIGMRNPEGEIILDTTLDAEDMCYLIASLSSILLNLLEKGKMLADKDLTDSAAFGNFAKHIKKAEGNINAIKKIAPIYKIKFD